VESEKDSRILPTHIPADYSNEPRPFGENTPYSLRYNSLYDVQNTSEEALNQHNTDNVLFR